MPSTTNGAGCGGSRSDGGSTGSTFLAASPFYAPRYHFGMLLGVEDFESEQAYHRGKTRLHNAWLHREGVVWGMGVSAPLTEATPAAPTGELRVEPGLALDGAGRELSLGGAACMSLPLWYAGHRDDPELAAVVTEGDGGTVVFTAHVVARFRACLSRAVPAISEPCVGAGGDTAYSRALETVELLLRPGAAPAPDAPYPRLRLLFGLAEPRTDGGGATLPADQEVLDRRAEVLALPAEQQPAAYLEAFRRFAALDEIELLPSASPGTGEASLFPAPDEGAEVVLAEVRDITLEREGEGYALRALEVDPTVRPSHVATRTIQELLCGPLLAAVAGGGGGGGGGGEEGGEEGGGGGPTGEGGSGATDAGGPRVDPASVRLEGEAVRFSVSKRLSKASVAREAFVVSAYDNRDGWHDVELARDPVLDRGGRNVRLELSTGFGGNLVRLIARGTGPAPLLGTDLVPLAGAVGGAPGGEDDGHDFVIMLKRSEQ